MKNYSLEELLSEKKQTKVLSEVTMLSDKTKIGFVKISYKNIVGRTNYVQLSGRLNNKEEREDLLHELGVLIAHLSRYKNYLMDNEKHYREEENQ